MGHVRCTRLPVAIRPLSTSIVAPFPRSAKNVTRTDTLCTCSSSIRTAMRSADPARTLAGATLKNAATGGGVATWWLNGIPPELWLVATGGCTWAATGTDAEMPPVRALPLADACDGSNASRPTKAIPEADRSIPNTIDAPERLGEVCKEMRRFAQQKLQAVRAAGQRCNWILRVVIDSRLPRLSTARSLMSANTLPWASALRTAS